MKKNGKRIWWILPTAIILLLGSVIVKLSSNIQNQMEQSATVSVRETVQLIAESLQRARETDVRQINDLAAALRLEDQPEQTLRLAKENGAFSQAATVSIKTGKGWTDRGETFDVSELAVKETALEGEASVSSAYVNSQGLWAYTVQCPIYENGIVAGALYADISLEGYNRFLPGKFYNEEGMLYLLDEESKRFILQPFSTDLHISAKFDLQSFLTAFGVADTQVGKGIFEAIDAKEWQIVRIHFDDVPSYLFFWPVEDSGWYLCGIVPESSIQRESIAVGRTIRLATLLVLLGCLLLIGIFYWSARQKAKLEKDQKKYRMELFDGIAKSINDVVLVFDCATGQSEIVFENIVRVSGTDYETIRKMFAQEAVQRRYAGTILGRVLSGSPIPPDTGGAERLEWDNPGTGMKQWIQVEALCMELMGTPKCILSVYDVTQEMLMQDSLRTAAMAAQNASQIKSEFLSHMSHEIRTPMNAVFGMLQLARRRVREGADPDDYLQKAETASQQLLELINDILDLSRIESGKMLLTEAPFRLDEQLNRICDTIAFQAAEKNQAFEVETEDCRNLEVTGDAVRLGQVMTNLLSNAVKYTPSGGKISFRVHSVPGQTRDYRQFTFEIADNGGGMSEEFQQRMFLPFERETQNEASGASGTGLGLSIVFNLISLMGGFLQVKSRSGEGSIFTVGIGLKTKFATAVTAAEPEEEIDLSDWNVLLAEDNELNREITTEFLKLTHANVDCAENGLLAYEAFRKSPLGYYGLILMDMQMPVWNGIQATQAIRALDRPDAAGVLIIAVTANAFLEDERQCLSAGMNDYLAKPLDQRKLFQKIRDNKGEEREEK